MNYRYLLQSLFVSIGFFYLLPACAVSVPINALNTCSIKNQTNQIFNHYKDTTFKIYVPTTSCNIQQIIVHVQLQESSSKVISVRLQQSDQIWITKIENTFARFQNYTKIFYFFEVRTKNTTFRFPQKNQTKKNLFQLKKQEQNRLIQWIAPKEKDIELDKHPYISFQLSKKLQNDPTLKLEFFINKKKYTKLIEYTHPQYTFELSKLEITNKILIQIILRNEDDRIIERFQKTFFIIPKGEINPWDLNLKYSTEYSNTFLDQSKSEIPLGDSSSIIQLKGTNNKYKQSFSLGPLIFISNNHTVALNKQAFIFKYQYSYFFMEVGNIYLPINTFLITSQAVLGGVLKIQQSKWDIQFSGGTIKSNNKDSTNINNIFNDEIFNLIIRAKPFAYLNLQSSTTYTKKEQKEILNSEKVIISIDKIFLRQLSLEVLTVLPLQTIKHPKISWNINIEQEIPFIHTTITLQYQQILKEWQSIIQQTKSESKILYITNYITLNTWVQFIEINYQFAQSTLNEKPVYTHTTSTNTKLAFLKNLDNLIEYSITIEYKQKILQSIHHYLSTNTQYQFSVKNQDHQLTQEIKVSHSSLQKQQENNLQNKGQSTTQIQLIHGYQFSKSLPTVYSMYIEYSNEVKTSNGQWTKQLQTTQRYKLNVYTYLSFSLGIQGIFYITKKTSNKSISIFPSLSLDFELFKQHNIIFNTQYNILFEENNLNHPKYSLNLYFKYSASF